MNFDRCYRKNNPEPATMQGGNPIKIPNFPPGISEKLEKERNRHYFIDRQADFRSPSPGSGRTFEITRIDGARRQDSGKTFEYKATELW